MPEFAASQVPQRRLALPEWRRIALVVALAAAAAAAFYPMSHNTYIELFGETLFVGVLLLAAYTGAGAWKQNLAPRWVVQLLAVAVAAPIGPLVVQLLTAGGDFSAFVASKGHVRGYVMVTLGAMVIGIMVALGALFRERNASARALLLQFQLERETLQRQAADARLKLMTAQIQPHFLLNTLANVQELVESGSPRAAPVFRSLIAYFRAAMPQLQQEDATLADEDRLVQAYLELMHMRMPDRLSYSVRIGDEVKSLRFPPMALLTLVENAIEHGVDPACEPAHVEVGARRDGSSAIHLWVSDTGVGMSEHAGPGTGLANLEARLQAAFGTGAKVELSEVQPHGVRADIRLRVQKDV
ncbi:hypothetical protein GCM10027034_00090 [Ramlibacter solisilvae]|uniref:sensor histidine kinase n=1 Tax=Ramlibacter tataouinensis TaxID=94132 RepID=UPI000777FE53|nr:histidine kinase [Ramlibacter tataouinensis]